jgi:riboflavin kinase/FMN adenylyltransferase
MSRIHDFRVEEIPEQEIQNETVSSTKIRKALGEGHIQRANAYLEHFFLMHLNLGKQPELQGDSGRSHLRLPDPDVHKLIPPPGGYAVSYSYAGGRGRGLLRIGDRGLLLYPEHEDAMPSGGELDLHFHKHLGAKGLEREMAELSELIY